MTSKGGKYRIQAVAEMTGVSAATLRAWERRYGFPSPERTSSSYRLYSDQDVELIQRMRQLCDEEGMSVGQAAQVIMRVREHAPPPPLSPRADPFGVARDQILQAISEFDPQRIEQAVRTAMFLGSAVTVFDRILGPALRVVGERWHEGELSVGQEHLASEIIGSAAREMLRLLQPAQRDRLAVLACFADEEHSLPLLAVAFWFVEWGIHPIVLGARTPPAAVRHAREALKPQLLGLSATVKPAPHRVRELLDGYAAACEDTPWIVGGAATEDIAEAVHEAGGIALPGRDLTELRAPIEGLFARTRGRRRR